MGFRTVTIVPGKRRAAYPPFEGAIVYPGANTFWTKAHLVESLLAIGVIVGLVWFWSDSLRAREFALRECKTACERADMQLLDQTVALASLGLTRDTQGRVRIRRRYRFDFSIDGGDRYPGQITLTAGRVESLWLGGTAI